MDLEDQDKPEPAADMRADDKPGSPDEPAAAEPTPEPPAADVRSDDKPPDKPPDTPPAEAPPEPAPAQAPAPTDQPARSAVLATEAPVQTNSYPVPESLVMAGMELPEQVVLVDGHKLGQDGKPQVGDVIGSVRNLRVDEGGQLLGDVSFADTTLAQRASGLASGGHMRGLSIGYDPLETVPVPEGQTATVGGRTYEGPCVVTTRSKLNHVALTFDPADTDASIRSRVAATMAATLAVLPISTPPDLLRRAVLEAWTPDRARQEMREHMVIRSAPAVAPGVAPAVHVKDGPTLDELGMALQLRAGLPLYRSKLAKNESIRTRAERLANNVTADHGESMWDILSKAVEAAHAVDPRTGRKPYGRTATIRAAVSSGSVAGIFDQSINLAILEAYDTHPDSTQGWCRETDKTNMGNIPVVRMYPVTAAVHLPSGGIPKHNSLGSSKENMELRRYEAGLLIDEQDIYSDHMEALTDIPRQVGEACREVRANLVYTLLMANPTLADDSIAWFHASSHGANLLSLPLSISNIEAAQAVIANQTANGRKLNLQAKHLIVSQSARQTGRRSVGSTDVITSEALTSGGGLIGAANVLAQDGIVVHADSRIGLGVNDPLDRAEYAASATGAPTRWFLAVDAPHSDILVAYRGGREPSVSMKQLTGHNEPLGLDWLATIDIGVGLTGYRGTVRSN